MVFLSIIVGFRNREPERVQLFLNSLSKQEDKDFDLVFIDYGSEKKLAGEIEKIVNKFSFARYHYLDTRGQHWNRSRCLNYGIRLSTAEHVFTSDVDFVFHPRFISTCRELIKNQSPSYFKVAYLDEKSSRNISETQNLKGTNFSDENAIGPLLISKSALNKIEGYDEFYEIWGLEDNDLKHRLVKKGIKLSFYNQQILIWHVWHPPIRSGSQLPSGWLAFLSDYFQSKNEQETAPLASHLDPDRSALHFLNSSDTKILNVHCKKHFLHSLLLGEFERLEKGQGLKIRFDFSAEEKVEKGRLNNTLRRLNELSAKRGWPLLLQNKNMEGYLAKKEAWETVVYFIKFHFKLIKDYYIPADLSSEPVILVKR